MSELAEPSRRPFLDKAVPEAWRAVVAFSAVVRAAAEERGLLAQESELIKVRASQLNGCSFCLDLHSREAREAGVPQQQLDLLPAWRETGVLGDRERAVLAVAEAATVLPLDDGAAAELSGARAVLGDATFAAAEWVAVAINAFNTISVLSGHPVRPRDHEGALVR
ncbi:AhpD family alkylhydroperoxidase [Isoptericola sp. CG 20/1183]|uniref:AhpD family alkylhydroperoxidase n=1 Tax=Isoptericola halotolerans TaxID=300560 RepID=A0ABX5EFX3_9MICO|nr:MULTISPECIES: carboxymuconolactone decarboxylase family protein [Isoptericola]MCK0116423.1 carboxymuconolactone decarboxylase family protein [Isoptericola sp. S6320L]PRZ08308.1 AhpD family alkylhydroperoxidase [Isoptericola halotolerans]PRZ09105.1 AhpD family alkylhydroperoxidase [Isoptericola sp. CG 20/1183]